jgi:hypothetical protein
MRHIYIYIYILYILMRSSSDPVVAKQLLLHCNCLMTCLLIFLLPCVLGYALIQPLVIKEALVTTVTAESIATSRALLADFDAMTLNDEVRVHLLCIMVFTLHHTHCINQLHSMILHTH